MTLPLKTSPAGVDLIKGFERCKLSVYPDPNPKLGWKVPTIGWGDTGPDVVRGMPDITQEEADGRLARKLMRFEAAVNRLVTVALTQHQFDALVAFCYNCGEEALHASTLLKLLNAGRYAEAADQFLRWNHSDGVVMEGLTRRREVERALFLS